MLAPTSRSNDTTVVQLPDIGLDTLRGIVAQMQAAARDDAERDRIGRALHVLLTAEIRGTEEVGVYLIQSCADSGTYYKATSYQCCCPDRQRTGRECKHSYCLTLLSAARAEADWQRVTQRWTLTEKGMQVTEAPTDWRLPCPRPCPLQGQHPCRPATGLRVVGRA